MATKKNTKKKATKKKPVKKKAKAKPRKTKTRKASPTEREIKNLKAQVGDTSVQIESVHDFVQAIPVQIGNLETKIDIMIPQIQSISESVVEDGKKIASHSTFINILSLIVFGGVIVGGITVFYKVIASGILGFLPF